MLVPNANPLGKFIEDPGLVGSGVIQKGIEVIDLPLVPINGAPLALL